jgi:hypothetical protein
MRIASHGRQNTVIRKWQVDEPCGEQIVIKFVILDWCKKDWSCECQQVSNSRGDFFFLNKNIQRNEQTNVWSLGPKILWNPIIIWCREQMYDQILWPWIWCQNSDHEIGSACWADPVSKSKNGNFFLNRTWAFRGTLFFMAEFSVFFFLHFLEIFCTESKQTNAWSLDSNLLKSNHHLLVEEGPQQKVKHLIWCGGSRSMSTKRTQKITKDPNKN